MGPGRWIALAVLLQAPLAMAQEEPPDAPAAPAAQQEGVGALGRFFDEVRQLSADFTQLELDEEGLLRRESSGRLYLSRPGRFRLDYMEPDHVMIWADGERLWLFDPELEQVTVRPQAGQLQEGAAALLAGEASVLDRFRVRAAGLQDGLQWFELSGLDAREGDLRLGLRNGMPAVVEFSDELGSRVRMLLFRLDPDSALDDGVFDPDIPPGVDIFEAVDS